MKSDIITKIVGKSSFGALAILGLAVTGLPAPASAQSTADAKIRKLEAEIKALQRRVFPGSDGRYFQPEISPQQPRSTASAPPSTTALTDILARLDAIEAQLQRLTSQVEENTNGVTQLSDAAAAATSPAPPAELNSAAAAATEAASSATTAAAPAAPKPAARPAKPSIERVAGVKGIAKPSTADKADDEYSYGFRLWDAGYYPEAQQQLRIFLEEYPSHWRATYARNLLGRAYFDDGNAREAATWFLRNYQDDKNGARAGDSLLYLAEAMIALKDTNRACIALAEFGETYPALASGRLATQYEADRKKVKCK